MCQLETTTGLSMVSDLNMVNKERVIAHRENGMRAFIKMGNTASIQTGSLWSKTSIAKYLCFGNQGAYAENLVDAFNQLSIENKIQLPRSKPRKKQHEYKQMNKIRNRTKMSNSSPTCSMLLQKISLHRAHISS